MRGDFFMTQALYSSLEKIAPFEEIPIVGAYFLRPNNGGVIFSQTVIVNKSLGANF